MAKRRKETEKGPKKLKNVLALVKEHVKSGRIIDSRHSKLRQSERFVTFPEIIQVLEDGWHEKAEDKWKEEYSSWNYAIRGKTIDGVELRVPVFYDDDNPDETYFGVATVVTDP